jgi:lysophospholipase L1-like esterase
MRRLFLSLSCIATLLPAQADEGLGTAKRILFLGDSITYAGAYVETFEWFLQTQFPDREFTVINCGLPSETVSGLSEAGHAGGAFPRPDLHERLGRVLDLVKPDLVFACYGMNDGIYLPFEGQRFAKFQDGMMKLHRQVEKAGARIIHLTPALFDPLPIRNRLVSDPAAVKDGQMFAGYDEVLERYARWLLDQRDHGWAVIDTHSAMKWALAERRKTGPSFSFAADGVHPNAAGQAVMAKALIHGVDEKRAIEFARLEASAAAQTLAFQGVRELINQRSRVLKDAYLTTAGHKRPGMAKGKPLEEAKVMATALTRRIKELWAEANPSPQKAGERRFLINAVRTPGLHHSLLHTR